jgi:putative ABC transport system permease protein
LITFLDDQYESLYKKESLLKQIVNVFSLLAILIANLGLFGLASYFILQRTKEMGIRKVLGATSGTLIKLVSGSFIQLVMIGFIVAVPLSWYLMNEWLDRFAYHISFNWLIVVVSGLSVVLIALATIVYHALHVARINPATTLRGD